MTSPSLPRISSLIVFLICFSGAGIAQTQEQDEMIGAWMLDVHAGYTTFSMPLLKQSIDESVNMFSARYNINVQKLLQFPSNWFTGGSFNFRSSENVRVTIGGYYTETKGAIGYRDISGRFQEDFRLQMLFLKVGLQVDIFRFHGFVWFLSAQAGVLINDLSLHEQIEFYELSRYSSTSDGKLRAYFLAAEPGMGVYTRIHDILVTFECGYRCNAENHLYDFYDTFNGWTVSSRVGIPLRW
jgi:hypothetical protein